jgi:hypothetical protein
MFPCTVPEPRKCQITNKIVSIVDDEVDIAALHHPTRAVIICTKVGLHHHRLSEIRNESDLFKNSQVIRYPVAYIVVISVECLAL